MPSKRPTGALGTRWLKLGVVIAIPHTAVTGADRIRVRGRITHENPLTVGRFCGTMAICKFMTFVACRIVENVKCSGPGRAQAVRRPAFPARPPTARPVADPDGRGARHLAELRQPDRAQPAAGERADPVADGGDL